MYQQSRDGNNSKIKSEYLQDLWSICVRWRLSQFRLVIALRGNGNDYKSKSAFLYFKTRTQSKQTQNKRQKFTILWVCTGTNTFPDALCIRKKRKRLEGVLLVELVRFKTNCIQEVQSALSPAGWIPFKCITWLKACVVLGQEDVRFMIKSHR